MDKQAVYFTKSDLRDAEWCEVADELTNQIDKNGIRSQVEGETVSVHIRIEELDGGSDHLQTWGGPNAQGLDDMDIHAIVRDLVTAWKNERLSE